MKRRIGVLAALTRWRVQITYYLPCSEEFKRFLRQDAQAVESAVRSALTDKELDAVLNCVTYTEYAVKHLEDGDANRKRFDYYTAQARAGSNAVKRAMAIRERQRLREARRKSL